MRTQANPRADSIIAKVDAYLASGRSLTPAEAHVTFGTMRKTTMRQAFEAAKVSPGTRHSPLVRRALRVMERGAGIKTAHHRRRKAQ